MNLVKMILAKLGHYLLTLMGVLRRAMCCLRRRRRMSDSSLPLTTNDLVHRAYSTKDQNGGELQNWDSWTEGDSMSIQVDSGLPANRFERSSSLEERRSDDEVEELFKDMAPTIRRSKKYAVKANPEDGQMYNPSSRLAVDIKATSCTVFHQSPDLGVIDDYVETWEDTAASEEHWSSPEAALREQKMAERERRLADHQKKKMEREQGRNSRSGSTSNRLS